MIAYLQGQIIKKLGKQIIVDTGNVGYLVTVPLPLLQEVIENDNIELFVYTNVRDDDISLYGMRTIEEYEFFKNLLTVHGIGPKLATDILSVPIDKMKGAILNEDTEAIKKIPGIGKKTAERIVMELKSKVDIGEREYKGLGSKVNDEAMEALANLGYQRGLIQKVLARMPEELKEAEEIIRYFLKNA